VRRRFDLDEVGQFDVGRREGVNEGGGAGQVAVDAGSDEPVPEDRGADAADIDAPPAVAGLHASTTGAVSAPCARNYAAKRRIELEFHRCSSVI
jgi:hypothetical protein